MLAKTYRFVSVTLPYLCLFWIWKLYRNNINLPCFSIKKLKTLRAIKVKLNAFQKHATELWSSKATNLETQNGSKSTNRKSQTMTFCFLRDPLRCESEKEKEFLDWASRMVNSELSLSIKEIMFGIIDNDSKFCLALNHLVIKGKYFLYVKALNGKF